MRTIIILVVSLMMSQAAFAVFNPTYLLTGNEMYFEAAECPQQVGEAERILRMVSSNYKALTSIQADFSMQLINTDVGINEVQNGKVLIKGEKYRFITEDFERMCDAKSVWTHFIEEEECQITTYSPDDDELTPANLFTLYEQNYKYEISGNLDAEVTPPGHVVIDLSPNDVSMPYYKVRLLIDRSDMLITKATIFEKNGNRIKYSLSNFNKNKPLSDSNFIFDELSHPNVDIIDLQ